MPTAAIARLENVLNLEERQNCRNRVVIGGLQAMAGRWAEDARAEGVDPQIVARAQAEMVAFGAAPQEARPAVIARLRRALQGEPEEETGAERADHAADVPGVGDPASRRQFEMEPADVEALSSGGSAPADAFDGKEKAPDASAGTPASVEAEPVALAESRPGASYVYDYQEVEPPPPAPTPRGPRTGNRPVRIAADLKASPQILQGVGPSVNELLQKLGIRTVEELLWHLPFRNEDYSQTRQIAQVRPGEQATILANLWDVRERSVGIRKTIVEGIFQDGTGTLTATWWSKWVRSSLRTGETYRLSGKIGLYLGKKTIENPAFEEADTEAVSTGRITPIYPLTEGLSQKKMRQLTRQVLEDFSHLVTDPLPPSVIERYALPDLRTALWQMHFPDTAEEYQHAKRRLAFEELLYVQLGVEQRRGDLKASAAPVLESDVALLETYAGALPFALTGAQERVLAEVADDMRRSVPMTRLVQGDVGSGKTAVAAGAMWVAARSGFQSALLAPTQILAEQHFRGLQRLLQHVTRSDGEPLRVALLTGRVGGGERTQVLDGLRQGEVDVIVGTTALIQEGVEIARLGLVVVDEQHRFGVEQRGALRSGDDIQPHMIVMSATPIPRSLALTVYGDLDLSTLDEMPPGRQPVRTVLFRPQERERIYGYVRKEANMGRQAFIVYPLVEESENVDAGAATEAFERLQKEVFPDLRLALLHGQMKGSEKDAIMSAFAAGSFDVLVSTSVIEVGIDVPNATVIIVEDAERFGLAQLHQFRGRVGRGEQRSYCVLVSRADGEAAQERLRVLESTTDGFVLAEKDLQMRGPGDFLGKRQSGLPELRVAAFTDLETLTLAREAAQGLYAEDPTLSRYPELRAHVQRFWRGEGDIS